MSSCNHTFDLKVWQGNNLYLQCSKCNYIYQCNHDWEQKYLFKTIIYKCSKCNLDVIGYKCSMCNFYTPHWFVEAKGEWESKNTEYKKYGTLEEYKCLICGNLKTTRYGGSFARMR
jgi:hypothetical protein